MLSGGDGIPAKPLYKNPITIQPRHLCILTTNHMPQLSEVIPALVERLLCIPFPVTFADLDHGELLTTTRRQRDISLKERLKADSAGVLNWLVKGAVMWYATKSLKRDAPTKVRDFCRAYFEDQDAVASFLRERCVFDPDARVASSDLLVEYNEWAERTDNKKMNAKSLASNMLRKGVIKKQMRLGGCNCQCYSGITLNASDCNDTDNIDDSPLAPTASARETYFCKALETRLGVAFQRNERPFSWLSSSATGKRLELDMYLPDRRLAIEYDGPHHRIYPNMYHESEKDFQRQRRLDREKDRLCAQHGINLFRVKGGVVDTDAEVDDFLQRLHSADVLVE